MDVKHSKLVYELAIHFHHVSFIAENSLILDKVIGSFPSGKITVMVGPSGAGKTMLLKTCNGLLSPTK